MKKKLVDNGKKLVFSFSAGTILEYPEEDVPALNDGHHLILDGYPYGCKKHGDERIHIGRDKNTGYYIPCQKCVTKYGNKEMMEEISEKMFEKIKQQILEQKEMEAKSKNEN